MKIYFAAPLFSLAEKQFNKTLAEELQQKNPNLKITLPQEFVFNGNFDLLYNLCIEHIDTSDLVIAILDGADADSGTCFEVGYAYAKNKPIIGIRTDIRELEIDGVNLMLAKSCKQMLWLPGAGIEELAGKILL